MSRNKAKFKSSDFSKNIDALSAALLDWSKTNTPSVELSKGRIKTLTPLEIQIEFRVSIDNTSGIFVLNGPPQQFITADHVQYYLDKLIEIYDREIGRLLIKNDYRNNYVRLSEYEFRKRGTEYVPDQKQLHCRYCDGNEPDVTFQHKAHAVAQMFSNAALLSKSECDACNDYFGRTIEKDLGDFSHTARLFSRTSGQRGVPKRRDDKGRWAIEVVGDVMEIKTDEGLDIFSISEDGKTATSVVPGKPVRPIGALKALIKFALSIMPESDFAQYQDVAHWVREPDHTKTVAGFNPTVFVSFFEEEHPRGGAMLLKRSSPNLEYPYMSFVLVFGNHHYQCFLPAKPEMHAKTIKAMPHSLISDFKPKSVVARNLSESEPVLMGPSTVTLKVVNQSLVQGPTA